MCGSFRTEKDAVLAVLKKVFEIDLINRDDFIEFMQEAEDDGHVDENGEIEAARQMTDEQFMEKVLNEAEMNPTVKELNNILYDYSEEYKNAWDFCIELQNVQ
jgi:hypothetical protein